MGAPPLSPNKVSNPLLKYTLAGQAAMLDEMAVMQKPLLGSICLTGQSTVVCAPPNAGKTLITLALIIDAIDNERIDGDNIYYVDADDTTQGVADKVRLLDEYGVHVVAEGYQGFKASILASILEEMIEDKSAHGKFLVLDTFKKFVSLMSKADTSRFTSVIRRFVLAGGSLLCLSHTNKHTDSNGRNVFAGVSDIIDDVDCAYVVDITVAADGKRVATFSNKKRRGNNPDAVAYAYLPDPDLSYLERLASVHETDAFDGGDDNQLDHATSDADILQELASAIQHSPDRGKMTIVRAVAGLHCVSKRRVLKLLEQHTGNDVAVHRWRYVVRARGLHAFELLGTPPG